MSTSSRASQLLSPRWPFYETVMVRGYENLVDSGTRVDVNTGMIAAARLQALTESRARGTRIADLRVQMGRIIDAIHSTVPEELWPEILRKIDGPVAADAPADEFADWDEADDDYEPVESGRHTRTAGSRAGGEPETPVRSISARGRSDLP